MTIEYLDFNDKKFDIVKKIRYDVFEAEQGAILTEELDEYDHSSDTVYLLLLDGDKALATGRIAKAQNGFKIGRIAVVKSERGKGLGAVLVNALCDKAYEMGAEKILVDAQLHAIPFYEKLGFSIIDNKTIIDRGIEHMPMVK